MRRIFFGTGTLVLGLATLMWATAPISAQHGAAVVVAAGGGRGGGGVVVAALQAAAMPSLASGRSITVPAQHPTRLVPVRVRPAGCGRARSGPSITRARRLGAPTAIPTETTISGTSVPGTAPF